ncbi:hypothetical protein PVIIG_05202 [Plasmodium vivax India VII]|uniref:Uncharacterized protein n=1 Tax=Plasmodium vivax India VII TaxID=1077284 RepID=A0A0J9S3C0_PLAVI|nr:hypothetical protein PVIIG_05202 [Plasmodium vivax India VII]
MDPFLEDIWKKYNFDETVNRSDESRIFSLCNNDVTYIGEPAHEHKNICRKLLRNLKLLHRDSHTPDNFVKYCNNINNWLYYEINKYNISDDTINNIFAVSKQIIKKQGLLDCPYFTFNIGLLEPEKLVMLRIFNDNIDDIQEILNNKLDFNLCSCQNFIKQSVDLYKNMYDKYCSRGEITKIPPKDTCEIVNRFRTYYKGYLSKEKIKYELPELSSNTPINIIHGCPSEEIEPDLASPVQGKQSDRSIIQSASHALGAMVGIPPFLALIYKVNITFIQNF